MAAQIGGLVERQLATTALNSRLASERLLTGISSRLAATGQADADRSIEDCLAEIGRFAGVDRSYVFLFSPDHAFMSNSHEWCADGISREKDNLQDVPLADVPWWWAQVSRPEPLIIPRVEDMPPGAAAEQAVLTAQQIQSLLVLPMRSGDILLGYVGFDMVRAERRWTPDEVTLLRMLAEMLASNLTRTQAEQALHEAERFAVSTLDSLADHIAILNEAGRIVAVNARWRQFAVTNPPITVPVAEGANYLAVCDAATGPDAPTARAFAAGVRDVLAGRQATFEMEYPCHSPKEQRWFVARVTPFAGVGPVRVVVAHENITARRQAESKVAEREAFYRSLLENASDLVTVLGQDGTIIFDSPAKLRLLGRTAAKTMGQQITTWIHSEDIPQVTTALQRSIARPGETVTVEYRTRHEDGSWRTMESGGRCISGADGRPIVVVNSRDVTATRELEEQLRQSQKMDAIGHLAGGVAHDFNNILAVILMQTDLLQNTNSLHPAVHAGLQQVRAAAERAANLTRQLLLFSRKEVMQPRDLDLNECVTGFAKMLQRIIGEDVSLELHLHAAPLMTHADPGMLDQVLMNLAVNARDAMPKGGRLRIASGWDQSDAAATRLVYLRVSDTGTGITPNVLPHIFEPFFTTKEPGKGTGLGLATVYGIVKQHGGRIDVHNQPEGGASFTICLPALPEIVRTEAPPANAAAPRGGDETLLLVEDDPAIRQLAGAVLEQAGYRMIEAPSGVEALQLWPTVQDQTALLLTDIVMPDGVSGHELARRLRESRPGLKVVYMTGYSAEIAGSELKLHADECLLFKPFAASRLLQCIRECLDG